MGKVTVIAAHNLRFGDLNRLSDPYVNVVVGEQRLRTPVIPCSLDPEWNCTLCFSIDEAHLTESIDFTIHDEDPLISQSTGSFSISVRRAVEERSLELREEALS